MLLGIQRPVGGRGLFDLPFGGRWWVVSVLVCTALVTLPPLVRSTVLTLGVLITVAVATLAMIGLGVRRHRPPAPLPWYLLAASAVLFAVGTGLRDFAGTGLASYDDIATLAGYAGIGAAAFRWLAPRRVGDGRDLLLDSGLIGLGALLASWTFLISPLLRAPHPFGPATVIDAAYPVIDAVLLAVVTHSVVMSSRSEIALRLVHLSLVTMLIADLGYNLDSVGTLRIDHQILLAPLLPAYLLVGAAALHPTMVTVGGPRRIHPNQSRRRASVVAIALVVASLVPTVGYSLGTVDRAVVSTLLAVLLIGVLARSERAIARSAHSERRAQYQADHDMLTGLLNRSALLRAPGRDPERWSGRPQCLLFLDLDGFKSINDRYGHAVGDELIAHAAARIRRVVPSDDLTARYGGDEFVVLICAGRGEAAVLAERLLAAFASPFELSAGEVSIAPSIGIACADPRGGGSRFGVRGPCGVAPTAASSTDSAEITVYDLLREADSAMYHAKEYTLGYVFHDDVHRRAHIDSARRTWHRETAV
jgi:diguanylate cyclase (GGDEF)-like protein